MLSEARGQLRGVRRIPAAGGGASWPRFLSVAGFSGPYWLFPKRAGAASCRAPSIGFINAADRQQCGRAVIVTIFGMIALTVAGAFWLARSGGDKQFVFEASPDGPCPFGCGMAWLAIRSDEPDAVIEALRLENAAPCNWNSGVGAAYDDWLGAAHVFVSPPVRGWTFVVGLPLPHPVGRGFVDKCTPMLVDLGGRFDEVQYFFSYPPIDFYAWARVKDGRLVRAVAVNDEGIVWNKGRASKEERGLGLKLFELRGVRERKGDAGGELIMHPTEDHVMRLASRWSLDPTTLNETHAPAAFGHIAMAPQSWRAERIRRAA